MGKHHKKEKSNQGKGSVLAYVFQNLIYVFFTHILDNCPVDVEKYFSELLSKDESLSAGIAAIRTLLEVLKKTKCKSSLRCQITIVQSFFSVFILLIGNS